MKELGLKYYKEDEYRELFVVMTDPIICESTAVGITNDGELLYIESKLMNNSSAYWMQEVFYSIDKDEYLKYLGVAAKNISLQKSISKGATSIEVSYKGKCFSAGSSLKYIISHKEFSVFTDDTNTAEELEFDRIDKFEYEKTIQVSECDSVRIIHRDAESDIVFFRYEFSPSEFEQWLDTLK